MCGEKRNHCDPDSQKDWSISLLSLVVRLLKWFRVRLRFPRWGPQQKMNQTKNPSEYMWRITARQNQKMVTWADRNVEGRDVWWTLLCSRAGGSCSVPAQGASCHSVSEAFCQDKHRVLCSNVWQHKAHLYFSSGGFSISLPWSF